MVATPNHSESSDSFVPQQVIKHLKHPLSLNQVVKPRKNPQQLRLMSNEGRRYSIKFQVIIRPSNQKQVMFSLVIIILIHYLMSCMILTYLLPRTSDSMTFFISCYFSFESLLICNVYCFNSFQCQRSTFNSSLERCDEWRNENSWKEKGHWYLQNYQKERQLSEANGCSQSSIMLMGLLKGIKQAYSRKGIHSDTWAKLLWNIPISSKVELYQSSPFSSSK